MAYFGWFDRQDHWEWELEKEFMSTNKYRYIDGDNEGDENRKLKSKGCISKVIKSIKNALVKNLNANSRRIGKKITLERPKELITKDPNGRRTKGKYYDWCVTYTGQIQQVRGMSELFYDMFMFFVSQNLNSCLSFFNIELSSHPLMAPQEREKRRKRQGKRNEVLQAAPLRLPAAHQLLAPAAAPRLPAAAPRHYHPITREERRHLLKQKERPEKKKPTMCGYHQPLIPWEERRRLLKQKGGTVKKTATMCRYHQPLKCQVNSPAQRNPRVRQLLTQKGVHLLLPAAHPLVAPAARRHCPPIPR